MKSTVDFLKAICFGVCLAASTFAQQPDGMPMFTTIDVPGAGTGTQQGTTAAAINATGVITGYYCDAGHRTTASYARRMARLRRSMLQVQAG